MADNVNTDKQLDKGASNTAFKLFQPTQPGPPSINFWAQPNELSEMLKKNSAKAPSFKLQPSIINVSAFKEGDKPSISDFSTTLQTSGRGRKSKALAQRGDSGSKAPPLQINKFDVMKAAGLAPKAEADVKHENAQDDSETALKQQIKAHQFDSEAEDIKDFVPFSADFAAELCFVERSHVSLINRKIGKSSKKLIDLIKFIKKRENDTNDVKTYACKYCPKIFGRRAALGGHTAKNHPHQSDSYRIRQESLKNRRIERERFDYFKTIEPHNP